MVVLIWEIGLVGKAPVNIIFIWVWLRRYAIKQIVSSRHSSQEIIAELRPVLEDYSKNRAENERFGDFCIRKEYVKETGQGSDFHDFLLRHHLRLKDFQKHWVRNTLQSDSGISTG